MVIKWYLFLTQFVDSIIVEWDKLGKTILITGISGIGKTTVAKRVSCLINAAHVCVGYILENLAKKHYGLMSRDQIKNMPLTKIQALHCSAKMRILAEIENNSFVVLDDHLRPLSKGQKPITLPHNYVSMFSIKAIFTLYTPPEIVYKRIQKDISGRNRLQYSPNELEMHMRELCKFTYQLADKSKIPCFDIEYLKADQTVSNILSFLPKIGWEM